MAFEAARKMQDWLDDMEEAQASIDEMFEHGVRPVVTVKPKWADTLQKGLPKHTSWIPEFNEVVGTMGVKPYIPDGEKRLMVEVNLNSPKQIHPRMTGPDKKFHGVVVLTGPISPDTIKVVDPIEKESEKD